MDSNNINLTIDGIAITVPKGTTIYTAAKNNGIEIPIFCYLDRMPPFGACRMCLVEVEKMPKLQTACTLEVTEGMVVKTQSQIAVEGRDKIIEFLLINHPLDCPICDKGGECPLQENALNHGSGESRFFEEKRHFRKPHPLGPVLMLDRERCIICARCTRFGDIIAGDHALEFKDRGFKTEVGTPNGGPAESKFIGNTIKICPVGALTSQVYRFRARPWDNHATESTCTLCPIGCSMIIDSRDGQIMRTRSREDLEVNDIWMCDKGWFGYEFVSHPERVTKPLIKKEGKFFESSWDEALEIIAQKIREYQSSGQIAAFGGNNLTIEENYLFQKLFRDVFQTPHLDHRIEALTVDAHEEGLPPGMTLSLKEVESLKTIYLLGVDITEEFPVLWLRIKQAINLNNAKVIFIGHFEPEISKHLNKVLVHTPGQELNVLKQHLNFEGGEGVFVGSQYLKNPLRLAILRYIEQSRAKIHINLLEGSENSLGARYAGMHPVFGPQNEIQKSFGLSAKQVLKKANEAKWDFIYVAGANPATKFSNKLWNRKNINFLVVQDLFLNETAKEADIILPSACFVEKGGHFLNIEKRVQKLLPGKVLPEGVYLDSEIFIKLAEKFNKNIAIESSFLESLLPGNRLELTVLDQTNEIKTMLEESLFFATFATALFDKGVRMNHDLHLRELIKAPKALLNQEEGEKLKVKTNDNITIKTHDFSVQIPVYLDKSIPKKTIILPLGFPEIPLINLAETLTNGISVEITKSSE